MSVTFSPCHVHVPVFAGQGVAASGLVQARQQAALDAKSPLGTMLLTSCFEAFGTELSALSSAELQESDISSLDFTEPGSLLSPSPRYAQNPIISGTSLLLVQSLRYLSFVLKGAEDMKSPTYFQDTLNTNIKHDIGVLGFSSGIIPACAVGASQNTLMYMCHTVEAFRLAFWIGLRSLQFRKSALREIGELDPALPWSLVCVGLSKASMQDRISNFERQRGLLSVLQITAIFDDQCVTVSGRPDQLEQFSLSIAAVCTIHKTTVDTLYHSSVHTFGTRTEVLADVVRRRIRFPDFGDLRCPPRSTLSGHILGSGQGSASLVEAVIDMVLVHPVNWDLVTKELGVSLPPGMGMRLLNFGPGTGLARTVEKASPNAVVSSWMDVALDMQTVHEVQLPPPFQPKQEPIAIVGMAVHMPGSANASELWEVLSRGLNTLSEIPGDRFNVSSYTDSPGGNSSRTMKAHTGNFLEGHDEFDHKFFKISPREARSMDPQQRILLHTAYEALENAGYVPDATPSFHRDSFGCYIGAATQDYADNLQDEIDVYYSTGNLKGFLSGRISYAMQFGGPSVVVDTACSSSIVAIYQACRALMNKDCNSAIAGGVNIITSPNMFLGLDRGHFLSPTGQCKAFDASADGYSRGEGCGLFVLKRLVDAVAENDNILGVIRGIEVNQSGLAHSITHPHAPTQAALFEKLVQGSGISASRVSVVEAHGTGTQAGDPCELSSIRSVFTGGRTSDNPLHITSIKANIGHLEAASGAAGLSKLLLMLRYNMIPAQISLKTLNPKIAPLDEDHTVIDTLPCEWTSGESPRVAVLNNFGAAGSNGAMIIEEHPSQNPSDTAVSPCIFGLSAKSELALEKLRVQYTRWLRHARNKDAAFTDVAYTATARRQIYPYRMAVSANTKDELVLALAKASTIHVSRPKGDVIFVFSGQGSQHLCMGASLYSASPIFRHQIDKCHALLVASGFPGVLQIITAGPHGSGLDESEEFEAYQAAMLVLGYALSKLWAHWGVSPSAVVGHSLGEYAALVTAGVLAIEDALYIVAHRARLIRRHCFTRRTGMLAIGLGFSDLQELLETSDAYPDLSIACVNSASDCTVSGPLEQLNSLKSCLAVGQKGVLLEIPLGYHSNAMQPILAKLDQIAGNIPINAPVIPVVSNVLGVVVSPGDKSIFNQSYFSRHCVQPVLFAQGVEALAADPALSHIDAWIEIGPHTSCLPMIKSILALPTTPVTLLPSLRKRQDARTTLTSSLSQLYLTSVEVHWRDVFAQLGPGLCVDLPSYPFEAQKFWVQYDERDHHSDLQPKPSRLVNEYMMLHSWVQYPSHLNGNVAIFETPMNALESYIQGHKVAGYALCPASVYLEQALAGATLAKRYMALDFGNSMPVLRGVQFAKPLVYHKSITRMVLTRVTIHKDGTGIFSVTSRLASTREESIHVQGEIRFQSTRETTMNLAREMPTSSRQITAIKSAGNGSPPETFTTRAIYEVLFARVVEYSKEYHTIQSLTVSPDSMEGVALIQLPSEYDRRPFAAHPVFVDTLLHVAGFIANMQGDGNDAYICSEVGTVKVLSGLLDYRKPYTIYCSSSWMSFENLMLSDACAILESEPRQIVAHLKGVQFRRVRLISLTRGLSLAADPMIVKTRRRTDSNAIISPVSPRSIIFARSRSNTQNTDPFRELHGGETHTINESDGTWSSSEASSPKTLVSDEEFPEPLAATLSGEDHIRGIMSHALGLCAHEIDDHSDFQSLGLDSLTSIEALQAFRVEMGLTLPHDIFIIHPTFASLSGLLTKLTQTKEHSGRSGMLKLSMQTLRDGFPLKPTPIHTHMEHRENDNRVPLFLFHDGSGLISGYNRLLAINRDVWGLPNPRFATGEAWSDLQSMSREYAQIVKKTVTGAVLLGGWSFGGVLAFEVARQLISQGVAVRGVLLIDSPSPVNHIPLSTPIVDYVTHLAVQNAGTELRSLVKAQFLMNSKLLEDYAPVPNVGVDPPFALLRSREPFNPEALVDVPKWLSERHDPQVAVAGWEQLICAPLKTWDIPGNHFEAFHPSNTHEVSGQIGRACSYLESL
ncbi:putative polyketide synthase [Leucogyrophana mollusca]|uniref:Polyketide synthase n=1 Tax=Leucogyrophana mollusca TaxID=85980 RepID=A0ACB8B0Z2_9AGAM|nr:putative polyketide synthase [Leucogyrophana mollusca]